MYWQGNLVRMLESMAKKICPSCHIPNHGSPVPKKELTFNCQQLTWQKPPPPPSKVAPTKKTQSIDVFHAENPTGVHIPEDVGNAFDHIVDKYMNAISSATAFDTSRPGAVCNRTRYTFNDCLVLL